MSIVFISLLCEVLLGSAVRNKNEIRGFKFLDTETKISQYADNTNLIIDVSKSSFSISLSLLDTFVLIYGLQVNCEKTEAFWILLYKNWETTISSSKPIICGKR